MSWNNSRCINSNYPLMMDSEWREAPFNEDDSYLDEEEEPPPTPPKGGEPDTICEIIKKSTDETGKQEKSVTSVKSVVKQKKRIKQNNYL